MAATNTPTPISSANIPFHTRLRLLSSQLFSTSPSFIVKGSRHLNINGFTDTKLSKNGGSGIDELDKATQRVELAKKKLAEIEKQEIEARKMMEYINQIETRVSELRNNYSKQELLWRKLKIIETQKENPVNKNKEKLESVKAAFISVIVGTLASLPIFLTHFTNSHELQVSTAIYVIKCALYGATYRYTIRRNFDDFHLKTGTSAAFDIVKGVATLDGQLTLDAFTGAGCVSENVLIFLFAAVGPDICYKMGIINPFPLETKTKM